MKRLLVYCVASLLITVTSYGQELKKNIERQIMKEDPNNLYRSDELELIDIAKAFNLLGLNFYRFDLGSFDSIYAMIITVDEINGGKLTRTDTIYDDYNTYTYYVKGEQSYYQDFLDKIKVLGKQEADKFSVQVQTYRMTLTKSIPYSKTEKGQFYSFRHYTDTKWKINQNIPMLVFASSWKDPKYGFQRFCGATELAEKDPQTIELLANSPKYYVVSYKLTRLPVATTSGAGKAK